MTKKTLSVSSGDLSPKLLSSWLVDSLKSSACLQNSLSLHFVSTLYSSLAVGQMEEANEVATVSGSQKETPVNLVGWILTWCNNQSSLGTGYSF